MPRRTGKVVSGKDDSFDIAVERVPVRILNRLRLA
jgi:hypothetical protein